MKKIFLAALVAAFGMTACQKTESLDAAQGDTTVTLSAQLPADAMAVRSQADPGIGDMVDRCIMEIYLNGQQYGERQVVAVENKQASFSVRLISGETYDFVFWADKMGSDINTDLHYNTADIKAVAIADIASYKGNDDERDAFFAVQKVTADQTKGVDVVLKRPFGQINIRTNDLSEVKTAAPALEPKTVKVLYKNIYTVFNALTGEVSQPVEVAYAAAADVMNAEGYLAMDYVLAPADVEQDYLIDFTTEFYNAAGDLVTSNNQTSNIPVKRNHRTNISGNLLTKKADIAVEVKPGFDGDINKELTEVSTAEEAQKAIAEGGNVVVTADIEKIDLTASTPAKELNLTIGAPVGELVLGTQAENPQKTTITVAKDVEYPAFTVVKGYDLKNLEIIGDPTSSEACNGIAARNKGITTIENVTIKGVRFDGMGLDFGYSANPQTTKNIVVENCVGVNMIDPLFQTSSNNYAGTEIGDIVIRNNTVTFDKDTAKDTVNGFYICETTTGTVVVEGNTIINSPKHGIMGYHNRCDEFIVRGNTFTATTEDGVKFDLPKNKLTIVDNTITPTEYGVRVARFDATYVPTVTIKGNKIDMSQARTKSFTGIYIGNITGDNSSPLLLINGNIKTGGEPNNWFSILTFKVTPAEGSDIATPFAE